jgi:hypothetical protein
MTFYHLTFYAQGNLYGAWSRLYTRALKDFTDNLIFPFWMTFVVSFYSMSQPGNYTETGFLFFYPIYKTRSLMGLFSSGSWMIVYMLICSMHHCSNKKYVPIWYDRVNDSSLFTYLIHDLFIHIMLSKVFYPATLNNQISVGLFECVITVFIFVEATSFSIYLGF